MSDKEAIFEAWAPPGGRWSAWVKPVLFAHLPRRLPPVELEAPDDLGWLAGAISGRAAIVVELPGVASVAMGLGLAALGYRPVPLFNACPAPEPDERFATPAKKSEGGLALVDVDPILAALVLGADRLRALEIPADAPPAFLLDSERGNPRRPVAPGMFDNRSLVFHTDFPSAKRLAELGITSAILLRADGSRVPDDLGYAMGRWLRGGMMLSLKRLDQPDPPGPLRLPSSHLFTGLFLRLWAWLGLRGAPEGGFGGVIPEPSSG